jgi:hypothetical protein
MNKIRDLGIKKNDVVRIKFKDINSIIKNSGIPFQDLDDDLRLSSNMRAYFNGGDFLVSEDFDTSLKDSVFGDCVVLKNHFDFDNNLQIYEYTIDTIDIVNDARRFVSSDLDLIVVRVEDELFINGQPLIGDELQKKKDHDRYKKNNEKPYENENRRLLSIFEEFIADLAVKDSIDNRGSK